jgi:hypothetical protein
MLHAIEDNRTREASATPGGLSFLFSDFALQRNEIEDMMSNIENPILAAGDAIGDPGVVHLFDSQDAFDQWAQRTRFAQKFEEIHNIVRRARLGMPSDPSGKAVRLVSNSPVESRWELAGHSSAPMTDIGATLFEGAAFHGRSFTTAAAAISDLNDIDFFNQVSSIRVSGVCMLADQISFGGARLYLVGDPRLNITDLKAWGFNNCAASAIIL